MNTPKEILRAVAAYYGLSQADIMGPRRWPRQARARQVMMAIMRQVLRMSYPEIGRAVGGRHHTTVMHSIRAVESDPELGFDVAAIIKLLSREGVIDDADLSGRASPRRIAH